MVQGVAALQVGLLETVDPLDVGGPKAREGSDADEHGFRDR